MLFSNRTKGLIDRIAFLGFLFFKDMIASNNLACTRIFRKGKGQSGPEAMISMKSNDYRWNNNLVVAHSISPLLSCPSSRDAFVSKNLITNRLTLKRYKKYSHLTSFYLCDQKCWSILLLARVLSSPNPMFIKLYNIPPGSSLLWANINFRKFSFYKM